MEKNGWEQRLKTNGLEVALTCFIGNTIIDGIYPGCFEVVIVAKRLGTEDGDSGSSSHATEEIET